MRNGILSALFVLCCITPLVWSRHPPNANFVQQLYGNSKSGSSRLSDNILEDSQLDVPGLIAKYGYPVEIHNVVTEDGYILELHRIPHGRDNNNVPDPAKPVVLVMPGLFCSSADWVVTGPGTALAYELAEAGFDVWLGNARGTFYSRKHLTLNPDDKSINNNYWNFSWEHIGTKDLPAMIDYALAMTGNTKLHYIGHSQGTTVFFCMGALRPEYNDKIITMQALAPVAYVTHRESPMINLLGPHINKIEMAAKMLGINELFPRSSFLAEFGAKYCSDGALTQFICTKIILKMFSSDSQDMHNATMLPVHLAHTPAGASVRQLVHFTQLAGKDYFRRFDYGLITNLAVYKSIYPPSIDLSKVSAPVYLHYGEGDIFVDLDDLFRLKSELGNMKGIYRVLHDSFSHLDFMWGTGALQLVYRPVINLMQEHE